MVEVFDFLFRFFVHLLSQWSGLNPYEIVVIMMFALTVLSVTILLDVLRLLPYAVLDIYLWWDMRKQIESDGEM